MTTIEFASLLAEWRERNHFTDAEAAAAVGARYGAFLHWLNGHYLPHYFTQVAVLRQIRDGRDPLVDVRMSTRKFRDAAACQSGSVIQGRCTGSFHGHTPHVGHNP